MELLKGERVRLIKDYPHYLVTDHGRVYSFFKNRFLESFTNKQGYMKVSLGGDNKRAFRVHRLVAMCFIPNRAKTRTQVNHIDHNKLNNHYSNLEWVTPAENIQGYLQFKGDNHGRTHRDVFLTSEKVAEIKKLLKNGVSQSKIAKLFDCSRTHICQIQHGKRWGEVK